MPQQINIGYVSELTGRNATLGVQGRNGAQLAVSEINSKGGISGRQLNLLIRDGAGNKDQTLRMDDELIQEGVVALTGHMTSLESAAAEQLIEEKNVILFSPTTSAPVFSKKKDNFFRLIPVNSAQAYSMAEYGYRQLNKKRAAIIYDQDNIVFTQAYANFFSQRFKEMGGEIASEVQFSSVLKPDMRPLVNQLHTTSPDLVLIIASSIDTAIIAQQIHLLDWHPQLMTANWAYTPDLLQNGGKAVENILISTHYDASCKTPQFESFKKNFQEQFGQPSNFSAVLSYETIQVLSKALEKTRGSKSGLSETLSQIKNIDGLCDKILMDEYGDVLRSLYIITIRGGQYKTLMVIHPDQIP